MQTSITDKGKWTPVVAATVQPTPWLTFYGNFIKALEPGGIAGGTAANAGEAFPPLTSEQVEGGAKARFGGVLATAALFRIRKANQYLDARTNLYTQDGLQENKGLELSVAGTVLPHLNLIAGATWIDAKQLRTAGGAFDGKKAPGVPKFTSVINADYDLPWIEGLTLSSSLFYTSRSTVDNLNTREADSWVRVDLGASYRFKVSDVSFVARASVENVANKRYWVTSFSNLLSQGVPRSLALSLSADF
ncbi:TonB-dependent receptor [Sphingobium fuliginis]|uniref:TonB-dependent receptor n=1 Tax=Sphingobium fuliginis (strain ATCC 27551) TaxID=336203 RepID=UPI0014308BEA|nr:TonB-dependent receptor [Sphingobium fuliginis]